MNEEWRPVQGYEGVYAVSNLGRLRTDRASLAIPKGKILKEYVRPRGGYCAVNLWLDGERRMFLVHRLVAIAFIPPGRKDQVWINHRDGNPRNNVVENLEWCTPLENTRHAMEVLGYKPWAKGNQPKGERHYKAKLTQANVDDIRRRVAAGESQYAMAREFGVVKQTIGALIHGKSWKQSLAFSASVL